MLKLKAHAPFFVVWGLVAVLAAFHFSCPADAQDTVPAIPVNAPEYGGLAMHGLPKYAGGFVHLDYANPDAPKGGTLKRFDVGVFDSLNPYALKGQAASGLNLFYERLMVRVWDEPFTLYPLIAEKVDVHENRSGLTVHVNPDARFHDGTPVTAEDVLFSFETLRDKGRPNMRRVYKLVETAEKLTDMSVRFRFGEGYDQETVMILAMMPVLSKAWWQDQDFSSTILQVPVSSGPYKISSVDPGRQIIYERDPDYWGADLAVNKGHYNFDRIIFDYYRDDTVAFQAFKSGEIDLRREWNAAQWAGGYDFPAVRRGDVVAEAVPHQRPERVNALIFNTRRAPFDDRDVRRALSMVLDFEWMNVNLFHSQYKRIESYFPNAHLAAQDSLSDKEMELLAPWEETLPPEIFSGKWHAPKHADRGASRRILREASEILDRAGWIIQDGVRVKKDDPSQKLSFTISLGSPEHEKIALAYKKQLERLGVTANIRVLDSAAFTGRLQSYDYDMVLHYWQNSLSPGTEQVLYWTCQAAEQPGQWNFSGICDPAVDALSYGIAQAETREDLVAYARALDRVLMAGYYIIPLYYAGADYVAYRKDVRRPQSTPLYGMVLETWWEELAVETE